MYGCPKVQPEWGGQFADNHIVTDIKNGIATCEKLDGSHTISTFDVDDLVVVAQFGEPIYPFLKKIDSVQNAPDSDLWHTLIEADNYHALQLLVYLYAGQVDCIYIDPPYNTGARDWKYNNDYVDSSDAYRHSKWLSMMQKRLQLAKKLLNPKDSVLIVTIDEKEYLHLGCLLEQMFPEANMQMVSSVIKHGVSMRQFEFSRNNEYIFFVRIGNATIGTEIIENKNNKVTWAPLRRHGVGENNFRKARPNSFYPIYVNKETKLVEYFGNPVPPDLNIETIPEKEGCYTILPVRDNGEEMVWGVTSGKAGELYSKGYLKIGEYQPQHKQLFKVYYLPSGIIASIENGKVQVVGRNSDNTVLLETSGEKKHQASNQWDKPEHDASQHGTKLIQNIIGTRFSYPKSLYAVEDCMKYCSCVAENPNAFIIDFFAGSGTTLHAVNLLNAEDGGHRRCILVTNNEVSDDEAKTLTKQGYKPGDEEWEKLGIARYVTWPRTVCSIEGHDVNGNPLKGNYIGSELPMEDGFKANAIYFKLGFLNKTNVSLGREFARMLSMLWMKAGAHGVCPQLEGSSIPDMLVYPENRFAVLNSESAFGTFASEVNSHPEIDTAFIITDSENAYKDMIRHLDVRRSFQLYRDYLDNFRINQNR